MDRSTSELKATEAKGIDPSEVMGVICAFREERTMHDVATRVLRQLPTLLVVDDGSGDATAEEARRAGAEVIVHASNQGKGAAIKTSVKALADRPGIRYLMFLDADGQHLPEEIPRFLHAAAACDAALILGNRFGDVRTMPWLRKATNRFMSWQISRLCGQIIPDSQCGFRLVRSDLLPLVACTSNHFDFETEMLIIAAGLGYRIGCAPVSTIYGTEISAIHPARDTVRFFQLMWRCRQLRATSQAVAKAPSECAPTPGED